ncbi:MAG: kinase [Solirubrobacteraceae bacterium]|nr:kinase [Solirubrobacteraceae bacterium]
MTGGAVTVLTHQRPAQTAAAVHALIEAAERNGVVLHFDEDEARKHGLTSRPGVVETNVPISTDVALCVVLGGDGTILRALRLYMGTEVPVFAVNFGEVGFLATIEPDGLDDAFDRAFAGEFELLHLPALTVVGIDGEQSAINDVSIHRKVGERVALLAYAIDGEEVGRVRCDGLVIATPAGSTGYNLANGGPVLAWGVEGYVVSFIAPHSLAARSLVVAPGNELTVHNRSLEPVTVSVDGRPAGELRPAQALSACFVDAVATLAQIPGSSFYRRLREKFGRLSA